MPIPSKKCFSPLLPGPRWFSNNPNFPSEHQLSFFLLGLAFSPSSLHLFLLLVSIFSLCSSNHCFLFSYLLSVSLCRFSVVLLSSSVMSHVPLFCAFSLLLLLCCLHHDGDTSFVWTNPQCMADLTSKQFCEVSFNFPPWITGFLDYPWQFQNSGSEDFCHQPPSHWPVRWGAPPEGHTNVQYSVNIDPLEKSQTTSISTSHRSDILI